jgi:5-methylcytosine-specific restriction endonuclease McrA
MKNNKEDELWSGDYNNLAKKIKNTRYKEYKKNKKSLTKINSLIDLGKPLKRKKRKKQKPKTELGKAYEEFDKRNKKTKRSKYRDRWKTRREKSYEKYRNYIQSEEWKKKAEIKKEKVGYKCEECKTDKYLETHHLTYKRLYNEPLEDLKVLCRNCHQKVHDINNRKS